MFDNYLYLSSTSEQFKDHFVKIAEELKNDLIWLKNECEIFATDFKGKLVNLNAEEFLACVKRNEKILC